MNAPLRPSDFIGELCVALAHRWEPERLFMALAFTAYLDESGTHEGSGLTIIGGLFARADHWKRFESSFDKIRNKHGFEIFHAKKFKKKSGDFKGWSNTQCLALVEDLGSLTNYGHAEGVAAILKDADYNNHYRRQNIDVPSKVRFDSRYGLCFRLCLYKVIAEVAKRKYRKKIPDLHIVLEAGHPNSGDVQRIFAEVKKEFADRGGEMLRTLTLAEKGECGPLMMADFVAHSSLLIDRKSAVFPLALTNIPPIERGASSVLNVQASAETLTRWREDAIKKHRSNRAVSAVTSGGQSS